MTGDDVAEGVCEILMNAEAAVCEELNNALSVRTPVFVYTLLSVHCYLFNGCSLLLQLPFYLIINNT